MRIFWIADYTRIRFVEAESASGEEVSGDLFTATIPALQWKIPLTF